MECLFSNICFPTGISQLQCCTASRLKILLAKVMNNDSKLERYHDKTLYIFISKYNIKLHFSEVVFVINYNDKEKISHEC